MNGPLTFRRDISVIEHDDDDGHKTVVLKNPVSGALFRLSEYEFRLIKQFDGSKSFEEVIDSLKREGQSYNEKHAESIVAKASSAGLMLGSPASGSMYLEQLRQKANQVRRFRAYLSPLSLYIPLANPDRFLDGRMWLFNGLFNRYTLPIWVVIGLWSLYVISGSLGRIQEQHLGLMNAWDLLVLWPAIAASRLVHEMGHAFVAKRYGVSVRTVGIAFLFFFPLPYCDTTDAWKVKSLRKRTYIGGAGIAAEMILASICSLIWFFTKPGTLNYLSFYLFAVSTVSTIAFNANPLLKFDGYFILSDYLKMPNLASKSEAYVKSLLIRTFFGRSEQPTGDIKPRATIILASYGILSFCYRIILLATIIAALYARFDKLFGLVLAGYASVVLLMRPVKNLFNELRSEDAKSAMLQRRPLRLVLAGVFVVALLCWPWSHRTALHCKVDSSTSQTITVPMNTSVSDVFIRQGSRLAEGDVMFDLDFTRAEFELRKARREREALRLQLEALVLDRDGLSKVPQKSVEIERVDQAIARMEAEIRAALESTKAPFDCVVTHLDQRMKAGYQPGAGVVVGYLKSTGSRVATAEMPDQLLGKLNQGQSVRVWFPFGKGYVFSSTISIIKEFSEPSSSHSRQAKRLASSQFSLGESDQNGERPFEESQSLYKCTVQLPDDSPLILGMTGRMLIEFPSQNAVSRMYQYAVQTMNRESFL